MNEKGESSSSRQIFPNEVGYAPVTPAKVGQPDPSQIWRNWLGNPFEEVVYEDTSVRSSFNCYDSYFGSTSQPYENNGGIFNMFSMDDVETWNSISCRDLLALADSTIRNSSGDSGAGGAGGCVGFDSQTQQYGRVNVLCDLNSPPQMVSDPLINTGLSLQFTPVTPDVTKRAEKEHALPDINGSTLVEANQDSEKGLAEQTNQNETPQQKPKRRKHRPKVVREGKPKRARNPATPATPKPATPKPDGSSTGKRKYVRRKGVEKSPATPAVDEANGVTHSTPGQQVKRTCKRKINFDESEKHAEATANKSCKMASEGVESYQKVDEVESPNPITPNKTELPKGRSKRNYTKAKCKIDFLQETCDKRPPSHVPGSNESRYCTNVCGNKGAQAHRSKGDTSSDIDSIKLLQEQTLAVNHDSLESFLSVYTDFNCVNKEAPPLSIINKGKAPETSNDRYMLTYGQHIRNKQLVVRESVSSGGYQHTNKKTKKNSMVPSFYHGHIGYNPTLTSESLSEIDLLVYRLECLHIDSNVVVPHTTGYHEKNAIVVYQQDRSVVPYEGLFDPVKKRKQRPKVDLDDETNRVWMLLLENINSQGVDGTDDQKVKWWEEERRVFRGRVDSFIARMHLVQGDRRFSRWKGSVLDSVVGVFLTQNVSDHLSSSAFMSLAARYPLKPKKSSEPLPEELYQVEEPVDHGRMMLQEVNSSVEKEAVNSNGYSRNCASIVDLNENSDSATCKESVLSHTEVEDIASSQNSADTCCIHKSQEPDKCNATAGGYTSFVELLHMQSKVIPKNSEKCASEESGISAESAVQATVQMHNTISSQESASSNSVSKASGSNNIVEASGETVQKVIDPHRKEKSGKAKVKVNWDKLRSDAELKPKTERPADAMDSMDYDAIRKADVNDVANAIKERGMNNRLAERIKKMLDRLVEDHGSTDLEWLRDVPPDQAKEYLLSFRGLGLKSVECIRLLTLHHLAFPVDTNVGRIAVRLGWVPLQPLPESLQLHLLELYPVQETIQKYLWPRLCKLDQRTLYELHYQMITFGKVFCTKTKPNCNACPLRGECRHFASAFASARLALPAPDQGIASLTENRTGQSSIGMIDLPSGSEQPKQPSEVQNRNPVIEEMAPSGPMVEVPATPGFIVEVPSTPGGPGPMVQVPATPGSIVEVPATTSTEPIVEVPASPEPEQVQQEVYDIEDWSADEEIPTIKLNIEAFTQNLQTYLETHMELGECDMSKALVAITTEAASIPAPKLKNVNQLRTEHQVYELPDSHPLLEGLERREPDDPCSYLLAIWTPGETADSIEPPEGQCRSQESGTLCNEETCFFCNSTREANSQTVRGTLLIPCRTAMRGSFPLNGTYFQVNEVFADHDSSLNPIAVPRAWLWNLPRRTVYFGTSIPSIFKGLTTEEIQLCFWRGFVCVRGFDQKTRAPRPLIARLHFPVSRLKKPKAAEEKEKLTQ